MTVDTASCVVCEQSCYRELRAIIFVETFAGIKGMGSNRLVAVDDDEDEAYGARD